MILTQSNLMPETFIDRIIGFKDGDAYVAVSLEFYLVGEGHTMEEAFERVEDSTRGYLSVCLEEGLPASKIYRAAPKKYQEMYDRHLALFKKTEKGKFERNEKSLIKRETQTMNKTFTTSTLLSHA